MQNFIQIASGVSVLRMRDFAPLGKKLLGDVVPRKEVPFGGRETKI